VAPLLTEVLRLGKLGLTAFYSFAQEQFPSRHFSHIVDILLIWSKSTILKMTNLEIK